MVNCGMVAYPPSQCSSSQVIVEAAHWPLVSITEDPSHAGRADRATTSKNGSEP